jgi:hypothetical protein
MRRPRHFRTSSRNFAISAISRASSLVIRRASARLFLIVHISDREAVRVLYDEARIVVVFDESRAVGSVSQTFHFLDYGLKETDLTLTPIAAHSQDLLRHPSTAGGRGCHGTINSHPDVS